MKFGRENRERRERRMIFSVLIIFIVAGIIVTCGFFLGVFFNSLKADFVSVPGGEGALNAAGASQNPSADQSVSQNSSQGTVVSSLAGFVSLADLPVSKSLPNDYYVAQTFNNCGPAALSMDFSYFGTFVNQETIADDIRPTHNLTGQDDDKSTTPDQLVAEGQKFGFVGYFRPNGSINLLEQFIANGIPVIVRTRFTPAEDYAHYRLVYGYDSATGTLLEKDGFQGASVSYSYADFMNLWNYFNDEYVVEVSPDKQAIVEAILGKDLDADTAWAEAVADNQADLAANPDDTTAGFNLSVALYYEGDYQQSVAEFEKVEPYLPPHVLWYQIEPLESYLALGDYAQVFTLSDEVLYHGDIAYPEMYVLQGQSYLAEGRLTMAEESFQLALYYNKNLVSATQGLAAVQQAISSQPAEN